MTREQTSLPDAVEWATAEDAADHYKVSLSDLLRWLAKGLVYGYHKRGSNGGWFVPLKHPSTICTEDLRIKEKYAAA